jgi:hypothetical protein
LLSRYKSPIFISSKLLSSSVVAKYVDQHSEDFECQSLQEIHRERLHLKRKDIAESLRAAVRRLLAANQIPCSDVVFEAEPEQVDPAATSLLKRYFGALD